jgi:L-ribulose-5-phosphate 3-epimerase
LKGEKMKSKIGVVTSTYPNFSGTEAMEGISKAGFKYIELASAPAFFEHMPRPEKSTDKKVVDDLLELCKKYGLTFQTIAGHTRLMQEDSVENFKAVLDFAGLAGVRFVTTDTGEVKNADDEKKFYDDIAELADHAKDKGITICFEMHGKWCNNGRKGAEIIKTIEHPNIKLNYDTGNVILYGNTRPEEDLKYALPYMGHLHLKDHGTGKLGEWNFPALGSGVLDFDKIFDLLKDYEGPSSVEMEFEGKEHTLDEINQAVKESFEFLNKYGFV